MPGLISGSYVAVRILAGWRTSGSGRLFDSFDGAAVGLKRDSR